MSNVVSIFTKLPLGDGKGPTKDLKMDQGDKKLLEAILDKGKELQAFVDIAKKNKANQERIKKERLNANKSVLRKERIKD